MSDAAFALAGFRAMVQSDLQGGELVIGDATYDCTVGTFAERDVLVDGGVSPMLLGDAQVAIADFVAGFKFYRGLALTVKPNTGAQRKCDIQSAEHQGPLVNLVLHDIHQGA
jgi:hypothetical protein